MEPDAWAKARQSLAQITVKKNPNEQNLAFSKLCEFAMDK